MPTPAKGARLGGSPAHERLILANLATQLFEHGRIVTTETKARRLRPLAEKLITKAKRGDIHARRQVLTTVRDKSIVHELFTEIAPSFNGREGGYTRITKVGPRKGDNAPMAMIELVTESLEDSKKANVRGAERSSTPAKKTAPARTGSSALAASGATNENESPTNESPAEESPVEELPAEELASDTEARDESASEQQAPSDDTSQEEAAEVSEPTETEGPAEGRS